MNERIRELVKQAGGDFWQRLENDVLKKDAYITFDPPENLEKFVELIVRECEKVAKDGPWYYDAPSCGWRNPINFVCKEMKEHFGVEE